MNFAEVTGVTRRTFAAEVFSLRYAASSISTVTAECLAESSFPPVFALTNRSIADAGATDVTRSTDVHTTITVVWYSTGTDWITSSMLMTASTTVAAVFITVVNAKRTTHFTGIHKPVAR